MGFSRHNDLPLTTSHDHLLNFDSKMHTPMIEINSASMLPLNSRGYRTTHTCELCGFEPKTKNKYRERQDHLVMKHFKTKIDMTFPHNKPYICPVEECQFIGKDRQALLRHYTGKHGVLEMYVKEELGRQGIHYEVGENGKRKHANLGKRRMKGDKPVKKYRRPITTTMTQLVISRNDLNSRLHLEPNNLMLTAIPSISHPNNDLPAISSFNSKVLDLQPVDFSSKTMSSMSGDTSSLNISADNIKLERGDCVPEIKNLLSPETINQILNGNSSNQNLNSTSNSVKQESMGEMIHHEMILKQDVHSLMASLQPIDQTHPTHGTSILSDSSLLSTSSLMDTSLPDPKDSATNNPPMNKSNVDMAIESISSLTPILPPPKKRRPISTVTSSNNAPPRKTLCRTNLNLSSLSSTNHKQKTLPTIVLSAVAKATAASLNANGGDNPLKISVQQSNCNKLPPINSISRSLSIDQQSSHDDDTHDLMNDPPLTDKLREDMSSYQVSNATPVFQPTLIHSTMNNPITQAQQQSILLSEIPKDLLPSLLPYYPVSLDSLSAGVFTSSAFVSPTNLASSAVDTLSSSSPCFATNSSTSLVNLPFTNTTTMSTCMNSNVLSGLISPPATPVTLSSSSTALSFSNIKFQNQSYKECPIQGTGINLNSVYDQALNMSDGSQLTGATVVCGQRTIASINSNATSVSSNVSFPSNVSSINAPTALVDKDSFLKNLLNSTSQNLDSTYSSSMQQQLLTNVNAIKSELMNTNTTMACFGGAQELIPITCLDESGQSTTMLAYIDSDYLDSQQQAGVNMTQVASDVPQNANVMGGGANQIVVDLNGRILSASEAACAIPTEAGEWFAIEGGHLVSTQFIEQNLMTNSNATVSNVPSVIAQQNAGVDGHTLDDNGSLRRPSSDTDTTDASSDSGISSCSPSAVTCGSQPSGQSSNNFNTMLAPVGHNSGGGNLFVSASSSSQFLYDTRAAVVSESSGPAVIVQTSSDDSDHHLSPSMTSEGGTEISLLQQSDQSSTECNSNAIELSKPSEMCGSQQNSAAEKRLEFNML